MSEAIYKKNVSLQLGGKSMSIFDHYQSRYESFKEEEYSLQEYLDLCKSDPQTYATAAERMLKAIGEPEVSEKRDPAGFPSGLHDNWWY